MSLAIVVTNCYYNMKSWHKIGISDLYLEPLIDKPIASSLKTQLLGSVNMNL